MIVEHAERIASELFGIEARAERLTGERDENFWLRTGRSLDFVLKAPAAGEPPAAAELCLSVLLYLEQFHPQLPVPRVQRTVNQETKAHFVDEKGLPRTALLYTFLPGTPLMSAA